MPGTRRRRGRSRGQALVEFALVTPLFFLIFFSVIEFALIVASIGSYNFSARDAARLGSILGRQDTTAVIDGKIVGDARSHVQGLVMAKAQEVDIFRAASDGMCLNAVAPGGSEVTVDDPTCLKNEYTISGTLLNGPTPPWLTDDRDDSLSTADYLGVRILYRYTYLTGFIAALGTSLNLSSTSVQRLEPQEFTGFHGTLAASATSGTGSDLPLSPLAATAFHPYWLVPDNGLRCPEWTKRTVEWS